MRRPLTPLWLAKPSRFAALSVRNARAVLGLVVALVLASLLALGIPPDTAPHADGQTDIVLYGAIVDGVRHGGDYYAVAAEALRAGDFPLRPFVAFRLPTLAVVEAALPGWGVTALLWVLAAAVAVAWYRRIAPALARPVPRLAAALLLAAGLVAFVQPSLGLFHEVWAGLLIALSLAVRREGRWVEAVALGLCAVVIRETAALYVAIMAVLAWLRGSRHESVGWLVVLAVLAGVVAVHAHAVAGVVRPLDAQSPGWAGMLGFGHFVRTMAVSTGLAMLPLGLASPIVALALVGWAGWRDPLGLAVIVVLAAYALLLSLFGRIDTFYWGLLVVPLLLPGLIFLPDTLRDLVAGALDRRRITVTRVVR